MKRHQHQLERSADLNLRNPIGFRLNSDDKPTDKVPHSQRQQENRKTSSTQQPDSIILQVARAYLEKRASSRFPDGAAKELLERMEKIYIKYYAEIV